MSDKESSHSQEAFKACLDLKLKRVSISSWCRIQRESRSLGCEESSVRCVNGLWTPYQRNVCGEESSGIRSGERAARLIGAGGFWCDGGRLRCRAGPT